jgi:hypothetical protein
MRNVESIVNSPVLDGQSALDRLVRSALGEALGAATLQLIVLDERLALGEPNRVTRAQLAMALAIVLFQGLLARTPTAAAYVEDVRRAGGKVRFDHGALRTIRFGAGPTGELPAGEAAFTRIFHALGYARAGVYPLERLNMTGRAYAHVDLPESIPQYFLSELHVERFSPDFQAAAERVFGASRDALTPSALESLVRLNRDHALPFAEAEALLPIIAEAFSVRHPTPRLADYRLLLAESAEAAWLATEGSAFNHATDRVDDLEGLAEAQRKAGRRMKQAIELSRNGRVRQTAFLADPVERAFIGDDGQIVRQTVPGSFYEFIARDDLPEGGLDLSFDTGNAQGIFKMTAAAGP